MWNFVIIFFVLTTTSVQSYSNRYASLERSQLEKQHGIQYMSFTRGNPQSSVDIRDINNFDDGLTSVFVIHGYWTISLDKPLNMKDAIFQHDPNVERVIVVSWMDYSSGKFQNFFLTSHFRECKTGPVITKNILINRKNPNFFKVFRFFFMNSTIFVLFS